MGADGDSSGVDGGCSVTVHIRCSNGSKFSLQTPLDITIGAFKVVVAGNCDVPAEQQRLIYKGRVLKDEQTLQSYGVESDHTIHLVRGAPASSASSNTSSANLGASRTPNNNVGVGSNEGVGYGGAGSGGVQFPGLGLNGLFGSGGGSSPFGTGFPDFSQVQQQLTQNPNLMREMMNMPAIQNLMNNPDLMRNLIMSNPQMRDVIDRNPELGHVLNDPSILRQTLEAARNPELMREMMRNTDRAMSNIEATPEGFNMLRRMYENVQEPFLNATTMAGETGNDVGSNPFAALLGNQGSAQSLDGSSNLSNTNLEQTGGSPAPNANPLPNPWSNATGAAPVANTRATSGDTRSPGIAGLGGLNNLQDMDRMLGGLPDPSSLNQILQNPAMMQWMQSLMSNPQFMNQMLGPQMGALLEANPQLREMLQNPEFLRQLSSPETMQQLLSFQRLFSSQFGRQQPNQQQNQGGDGTGAPNNMGLDLLVNLFGGLGAGGLGVPNTSNVPPEELYATQLSQLQEMGFFDTQENIRALSATAGNVHAAVERLLGNPGH